MRSQVVICALIGAIVYGGALGAVSYERLMKTVGENAYDYFGYSVSSAGDVNGDGYDDVIVGAYGYDVNTDTSVGDTFSMEVLPWMLIMM